jgi:adenosylhomocysteine nucleosidase
METFAVAEVCARRSVPFHSVRIIHDPADQTLPPDIEKLLNQKTETARLGAAIGTLWKRPSSIKDLWALKENSLVASQKLADFIAKLAATW